MMTRVRRLMANKDQGFTLIELLVVVIIIGRHAVATTARSRGTPGRAAGSTGSGRRRGHGHGLLTGGRGTFARAVDRRAAVATHGRAGLERLAAHSAVAVRGGFQRQAPRVSRAATAWSCTRAANSRAMPSTRSACEAP